MAGKRIKCPTCKRPVTLTATGLLPKHRRPTILGGKPCAAGGIKPSAAR